MDDIYDNLENYEDVNDVTELKNENKELKQKLEEYSIATNQLQKDFEKLNSEYKKLELNYSSLLKTARAEIERKGEIIKNLNTEKDNLIINALKTKGKCVSRNSNNFNQKFSKDQNNYANTDKGKQKQNCVDSNVKPCGSKNNSPETGAPSHNISSNANENKTTTNVDKLLNIGKKSVSNTEMKENTTTTYTTNIDKLLNIGKKSVSNTEMKENISKNEIHSNKTSSSQRISNRRKSMPAASFQEAIFNSDEETDTPYRRIIRKTPPKNLRHDNRDYRTDIHSHCSTDSSRSRNSNNFDHNTQRHNEYDMKRYHRNYSPERYQHRYSDYNRPRVLKSPPSDKYYSSKSRDRRYNYERDPYYDRHRYYETSNLKHKIRNSFDEPNSKRQKTELYNKCPSQDSNYISDREKEFSDRRYIAEPEFEQVSCQSPDYIHSDSHFPQHLIKEIRNIAATSLEDPRISSKKYCLHSHNDQKFLFIPSARDIDIPCIDKMLWGLENVQIPEPLKKKPCSVTDSENYLNQIYNNINDNESIESGEIKSLEDDIIFSKAPENYKEPNLNFNRKNISSNIIDTGQKTNKSEVRKSSSTCGNKIPKIKKNQECSNKLDNSTKASDDINVTIKKSTESYLKLKESDKKSKPNEEKNKEVAQNVQASAKFKKSDNSKQSNIDKTIQDKIRTVEGDLELSDEESDTMEFQNEIEEKIVNSESNHNTSATTKIDKPYANSSFVEKKETYIQENQMIEKKKTDNTVTQEISSIKKSSSKDLTRDSKKRRSKKKSESKETTSKDQKDKKKSIEKNNEKIITKHTGNKFSDLFGDTSSLITPDDLGIPVNDTKLQDGTYALFENKHDNQSIHQLPTNTNFNTITESVPNKEKNQTDNEFSNINLSNSKCEMTDKEQQLNDNNENPIGETPMQKNNVVKTVIISTGIQPQRDEINLPDLSVLNGKNCNEKFIIKKDALSEIHALATSTPHKPIVNDDKMITSQNSDTINTNKGSLELSSSNLNNSSSFNTNQTEDVPEYRIIFKRKRKVIRKPT